jgi:hypothetical protein
LVVLGLEGARTRLIVSLRLESHLHEGGLDVSLEHGGLTRLLVAEDNVARLLDLWLIEGHVDVPVPVFEDGVRAHDLLLHLQLRLFVCDLLGGGFVHLHLINLRQDIINLLMAAVLSGRTAFWFATFIQWATMFVMYFVKFKMFTILGLFMVPMLVLQALAICLILIQIGKF